MNYFGDPYYVSSHINSSQDDEPIPSVSFGTNPIVRCAECRAYINPFVKFTNGGTVWVCNFCQTNNNVENYYYSPLNNGYRNDFSERKELQYGSVDFIASSDYMNRPPMAPTYIFVFDVSKTAIESGYLSIVTQTISRAIEEGTIPGGERTRVGFLTFDDTTHYYNLKSTLR